LLADYPAGSTPEDMMKISNLLVNCGASITEINAVRKHLSLVKGGQLARAVYPSTLVSIILSDVAGDPLDVIASGPTAPDPTTFDHALEVLHNYDLMGSCPPSLLKYLEDGSKDPQRETPKENDQIFTKTHNILVGTNLTALEAARMKAIEFNINALIVDSKLQGDVVSVADYLLEMALQFKNDQNEVKPVCLLFGGETTVKMTGSGDGGRNQHLALLMTILLKDHPGITVLSGGTDGNDGNTNAAGAVADSETFRNAVSKDIDPEEFIKAFDSNRFFRKAGGLITTGPTKTNVMDLIVVIVE
jgi:glycerate-2-kinase